MAVISCPEKITGGAWGQKGVRVQKVMHRQCSVMCSDMFSLIVSPAVTRSTHLCTHLEVSSERNLIMGEQLLSHIFLHQSNTWLTCFEFGWVEASFSMI